MIANSLDLTSLLKQLGLSTSDSELLKERSAKIQKLIEDRILLRLSTILSTEDINQIKDMPEDKVAVYLLEKGIDITSIALVETEEFMQEMADNLEHVLN